MSARQRLRQVSPQRIAKVVAALDGLGVDWSIKLGTDGSAVLTRKDGDPLFSDRDDAVAEINRALGIQ